MVDDAAPDTLPGRSIPLGNDQEDGRGDPEPSNRADDAEARGSRRRRRRKHRKINPGLAKKFDFLTQLLRNLDSLVYAELCTLYYMEYATLSFLFFVISYSDKYAGAPSSALQFAFMDNTTGLHPSLTTTH